MSDLSKLFNESNYDITLQPQKVSEDEFAVTCKLETMDSTENGLRTKRKVTITAFGKSAKSAQNNAFSEALKLLNLK